MNKHLKNILLMVFSIAVGVALFTWVVGKTSLNEVLTVFSGFPLLWLAVFILISLLIDAFVAFRGLIIIRHMGYKLRFFPLVIYRWIGFAVNYLTPTMHVGGEPVRAYLLRKDKVKSADAWSVILLDKKMELIADIFYGIFGIIILLIFFDKGKFGLKENIYSYLIMFAGLFLSVYAVIKFYSRLSRNERTFVAGIKRLKLHKLWFMKNFIKKLDEIEKSMCIFMSRSKKGFARALSVSIILWILMYIEYYCALTIVGVKPTLAHIFLVGFFIALSYLVPVPAAIGFLEAGQISAFALIGKPGTTAIAFSLIIRGRDLVRSLLGVVLLANKGITVVGALDPKSIKKKVRFIRNDKIISKV